MILTMNLYSDLNNYLLKFCSEGVLKALVLVNKEFSSLSVSEVKERAYKKLDISSQRLTEFPTHYPKGHLCEGEEIDYSRIEDLDCSDNKLISLPDCLENCEVLWCDNNQLTSLPDCLRNCEELDCRFNQLTSLPDCLRNCEELDCRFNQLTSLPDCLENCEELDCRFNQLTSLPDCLGNCEKLYCCVGAIKEFHL